MHFINETCVGCGACEAACPVGAITNVDGKFVVGDTCIDCGACEPGCPAGSINLQ